MKMLMMIMILVVAVSAGAVKEKPIEVEAVDLIGELKENEVAAELKYKGRLLKVSGPCGNIGRNILGRLYVSIESGKSFELKSVMCFFLKKDKDAVAKLKKGTRVTITGRCDGVAFAGIILKDCKVEQ